MRPAGRHQLVLLALASSTWAIADDGILYTSGAPRLMHGESNIRMVREKVTAKVYRKYSDVHCRFVFKNEGPATDARIGFPDGRDIGFEEGDKPYFSLEHFRSAVDGRAVALKMEVSGVQPGGGYVGDYEAPVYHVKTVHFAKGQTRIIEDWYRSAHSGGATNSMTQKGDDNLYISQFEYVMASGGSWKGNIDEAVVEVRFMEKSLRHLRTVAESEFGDVTESKKLSSLPRGRVIWSGYSQPKAYGNRVIFKKYNFKPTAKDNISLTFDWLPFKESAFGSKRTLKG